MWFYLRRNGGTHQSRPLPWPIYGKNATRRKVLFIGGDDMEMELVPKAGYELVGFPSASFCRGLNMHAFRHNARAAGAY